MIFQSWNRKGFFSRQRFFLFTKFYLRERLEPPVKLNFANRSIGERDRSTWGEESVEHLKGERKDGEGGKRRGRKVERAGKWGISKGMRRGVTCALEERVDCRNMRIGGTSGLEECVD